MIRTKKFFSVLLALVMVLALLPVGAAHATDGGETTTYTVSFGANGGTGSMDPVTVTAGTKYTLPENGFTAPEGKEFDKWDLGDPGDQVDITADTTVTATWKETAVTNTETYTVSFGANGGTGSMDPVAVTAGTKYTLPDNGFTAPEGKEFDKWDLGDPGDQVDITADTTVTATWKDAAVTNTETYTVTFNSNGGSTVNAQIVNAGGKATKPADPTREGYSFSGWYSDTDLKTAYDFSSAVSADLTLYAKWTENKPGTFTVTFDSNGGSTVNAQIVSADGKVTKPADPTREGYSFSGWYSDKDLKTAYDFTSAVSADLTLYAKWTENKPDTFTVSFETNGGSAVEKQTVEKGKTAANPTAPTKKGYSFSGWYSDKDLKSAYDFTSAVTADLTLYAKWTEIKYTVSAGANGYYTLKSNKTVSITVKRSEADDTCLNHFSSVEIDGKTLTKDTDYTVKSGSTVVSFKPETLEKLAKGGHTVTVNFDDGKAETKLTIYAEGHSPKTGDENNLALWGAIAAVCVLGAAGGLILLTKKKRTDK